MGSCRGGSDFMKNRMVQFPRMATRYMRQIGMETQMLACSIPGIPIKKKIEISISDVLKVDMLGK